MLIYLYIFQGGVKFHHGIRYQASSVKNICVIDTQLTSLLDKSEKPEAVTAHLSLPAMKLFSFPFVLLNPIEAGWQSKFFKIKS